MFTQVSKRWSLALAFVFTIGICAMFSGTASAQQGWDKKTMVTFSSAFEIPGKSTQILPAGTYVFKLMDSGSERHVVQILSKDESHLYANVLAIPNYRLRPTDKTVMTFSERKAGQPQAIRAWFYPGDNSGQEFVYPKNRAVELAKIAELPVLSVPQEVAPNIIAPAALPTEPPILALTAAPVVAVTPAGQEVAITEVVERPPTQTAQASLPRTASSLPLLTLMGLLCIGVGLWLRPLCVR